jgi:TonB-linked SusC/RagA family outer membrane protein
MKKILLVNLCLLLLCISGVYAQNRTVTGTVTSTDDGLSLPGVSVRIEGATTGTVTGADGKYSVSVPSTNSVLVFTYIGFTMQQVPVGDRTVVNVALAPNASQLNEVVVTALGIRREKRSLGYAVTDLKGEEVNQVPNQNVTNSLNGKVAGLQVVSSGGAPGSPNRVVIRGGAKSISGNNQALFVVDGVPVSNADDGFGGSTAVAGAATPNRIADINPNDIESVSVLKGSAASVLYGSRGSNGVILITTKSGKAKDGKAVITYDNSTGFDNPLRLPEYQTTYAQGTNVNTYSEGTSKNFGPVISGQTVNSPAAGGPITLSVHDPRKDFFRTGVTFNNNLSLSQSTDKTSFFVSAGQSRQSSIVPNQDYSKASLRLNATTQLTSKFTAGVNFNYVRSWGNVPFLGQDGNNPIFSLFHAPVSWDLRGYGYKRPNGTQINFRGGSFDNPFWTVNETSFTSVNDRTLGNINLAYKVLPWLDVSYRLGTDLYTDTRKDFREINTGGNPFGALQNDIRNYNELNSTFLVNINKKITSDFGISFTGGHDYNQRTNKIFQQTATSLVLPDFPNMSNGAAFNPDVESYSRLRIMGVFGDLRFDYKNYLFLGLTARNEWSSTLPANNRSYFYPGVNASLVFTDAFKIDRSVLSYGKIRASYAKTARSAPPYYVGTVFPASFFGDGFTGGVAFPFNGTPGFTVSDVIYNTNLTPEFTKEFEVGTELRFLNDRIGLELTYFYNKNTNGIVQVEVSPAAGSTAAILNSGNTQNKGIEVGLNLSPVKTKDFSWDMNVTFSRIRSKVLEIYPGLDKLYLGGFSGNPAVFAVQGQRYGTLTGTGIAKNENGQALIDDDGYPIAESGVSLGKVEPNWTGGIRNTFRYKAFSLGVLFDGRFGGVIYNGTASLLDNYGVSKASLARNDQYVYPGVNATTGQPNTTAVTRNSNYYTVITSYDEPYVYENNWVKLREANLNYTFKFNNNKYIQALTLGAYGRNLFLFTKVPHVDPESSSFGTGNGQGATRMAFPTTRGLGFNVRVTF